MQTDEGEEISHLLGGLISFAAKRKKSKPVLKEKVFADFGGGAPEAEKKAAKSPKAGKKMRWASKASSGEGNTAALQVQVSCNRIRWHSTWHVFIHVRTSHTCSYTFIEYAIAG